MTTIRSWSVGASYISNTVLQSSLISYKTNKMLINLLEDKDFFGVLDPPESYEMDR